MQFALLPYRGLIHLSGEDHLSFLQGLISNDVMKLAAQKIMYAALLSPQGKFLHDFFLVDTGDAVLIDCEKERMNDLVKRLSLYKLRSKVAIETLPDPQGVVALWDGDAVAHALPDPRLPELGWRAYGDSSAIVARCREQNFSQATPEEYDHMRLKVGVPDGSRDLVIDKSTLLPFGFEPLHGVDFSKGCYIGQEVTARTKHIGQTRKYLHKVKVRSGALPQPGTAITLGELSIGNLCSHADGIGLAMLNLDAVEKSAGTNADLRCGDAIIDAKLPVWAKPLSANGT